MGIGERIKELRKAAGLTQEEFAVRLKITKGFISNLEKERVHPSDQLLRLISYEYNSSEYWLTTGEGDMFVPAEKAVRDQIARLGERAFTEGLWKLLNDNNLVILRGVLSKPGGKNSDPDLDHMINFLIDLWSVADDELKSWARVQFARAFPPDIEEEVQKKRTGDQGQAYTG